MKQTWVLGQGKDRKPRGWCDSPGGDDRGSAVVTGVGFWDRSDVGLERKMGVKLGSVWSRHLEGCRCHSLSVERDGGDSLAPAVLGRPLDLRDSSAWTAGYTKWAFGRDVSAKI